MIEAILNDKSLKAKAKVTQLGQWLLDGNLSVEELISFASKQKEVEKANCIEAIEYATKKQPELANEAVLKFMTKCLKDEGPRVKWESARVVGNIAHLFPTKLSASINGLLVNTEHSGTVVRWAAAYALAEIVKLNTKHNKELLPAIEAICKRETDNAIKKKYMEAIKKVSRKK
jgi:HEAT repeat protein